MNTPRAPRLYRVKPRMLSLAGTSEYLLIIPDGREEEWIKFVITRQAYFTGVIARRPSTSSHRSLPGRPVPVSRVPQVQDYLTKRAGHASRYAMRPLMALWSGISPYALLIAPTGG